MVCKTFLSSVCVCGGETEVIGNREVHAAKTVFAFTVLSQM